MLDWLVRLLQWVAVPSCIMACTGVQKHGHELGRGGAQGRPITSDPTPLRQLDAGRDYACALLATGRVKCSNLCDETAWSSVPGITNAVFIEVDRSTVSGRAILADGTVQRWPAKLDPPPALPPMQSVRVGGCGITRDERLVCWAESEYFAEWLGVGATPNVMVGGKRMRDVDVGLGTAHAVDEEGEVYSWGSSANGSLGNGEVLPGRDEVSPQPIRGPRGATNVAVGGGKACALLETGTVECWGVDVLGKTPEPPIKVDARPAPLQHVAEAVSISMTWFHGCALISDGTVRCWGSDLDERNWGEDDEIRALRRATHVAAGFRHTCVGYASGVVECLGPRGDDCARTAPPRPPVLRAKE